jgi:hypothetical protein
MNYPLKYPKIKDFVKLQEHLQEYSRLKFEYGAASEEIERTLDEAYARLRESLDKLLELPEDPGLALLEPNALDDLRRLRPQAPRRLWTRFDPKEYAERSAGAFI